MLGPFTVDTVFPAFAQMGVDLSASTTAMQQVTSVYLLSFAVMSLFHGPISDSIGRKPVMIAGLLGYAVASAVCALAPSLPVLLVGRALQGFSAGAGQIISRTVIRDLYSGPAAQRMMAQVSMIFSIAPALAPIVGGFVLGFGSWHTIFWGLVVLGLVLATAVALGLPETHPVADRAPLKIGPIFTSLRRVLSDPPFLRLAFAGMFGFSAQFLYIVAAPIIMVNLLHRGDQDFWMLFVPMVSGMMIGSWISARFAHRIRPERLASMAFVALILASALNVSVSLTSVGSRLPYALISPPLVGLSMAVIFPVLQLMMLDRFPHHRGAAASGQSFTSLTFNALLSGVIAPLVGGSMLTIALAAATFATIGAAFWAWHLRRLPTEPAD